MDHSLALPDGSERAPAKVNLALHVRGRDADGYHRLDTLFAFTDFHDSVSAEDAADWSLAVHGPTAAAAGPDNENLVLRAARAFAAATGSARRFALRLDKRIPVAAGLGGGSADAAATLRLLNRLHGDLLSLQQLERLGADLGADVPACIASATCRGTGRGDVLEPAPPLTGLPILLLNPGVAVATGPVFRAWNGEDSGPMPADWRSGHNALEAPAITLQPVIADALAWAGALPGATLARMSGSGATCFALFANGIPAIAPPPGWWTVATTLR